jgi:hypothetical protein
MGSFRTFFCALAVVALAACGGGSGGSALPSPASDPGTRAPSGSTVAFQNATLWIGYDDPRINTFSTDANGNVTPLKTTGPFLWTNSIGAPLPGVADVAIAPDGTEWILEKRDFVQGGFGWRLFAVAPGDTRPEYVNGDDVHKPAQLGLAGDGVMVSYYETSGATTIATYPYAISNAPAVRTFSSTSVRSFAEGNDGKLYVSRAGGFDVYRPDATGCCPVRSIETGTTVNQFAVGPTSSIYVADLPGSPSNPVMYVNVYAPGSSRIARRIGPIPAEYNGFAFPVIAVDANDRLYVATTGKIYRFGPNANGAATPQRVMNDPTTSRPRTMAIGPKL